MNFTVEDLRETPSNIRFIKKPTEEQQLAVIRKDWSTIQYIYSPSEKALLLAVSLSSAAIKYIPNPSKAVLEMAISKGYKPTSEARILQLNSMSESRQVTAVGFDWSCIAHIKDPSVAVQMAAVKRSPHAIRFIKNPSALAIAEAFRNKACMIGFMPVSEGMQLSVIKQDWRYISLIDSPSEVIQMAIAERFQEKGLGLPALWIDCFGPLARGYALNDSLSTKCAGNIPLSMDKATICKFVSEVERWFPSSYARVNGVSRVTSFKGWLIRSTDEGLVLSSGETSEYIKSENKYFLDICTVISKYFSVPVHSIRLVSALGDVAVVARPSTVESGAYDVVIQVCK